jgi:hypothetical protein
MTAAGLTTAEAVERIAFPDMEGSNAIAAE